MMAKNNFISMIRVNKAKNYKPLQLSRMERYGSNDKNNLSNNYSLKSNDNTNFISKYSDYYSISSIQNNHTKQLNHYQSKDSLNDQLNLIKFKMSCDLIGQKINQLKTFVDLNDDNDKKFKKIDSQNTFYRTSNINNRINNNNSNINIDIGNYHNSVNLAYANKSLNHISLNRNNNDFLSTKTSIGKYSSNAINNNYNNISNNNINYQRKNIMYNTNTNKNKSLRYIYHLDNYFVGTPNKFKNFHKNYTNTNNITNRTINNYNYNFNDSYKKDKFQSNNLDSFQKKRHIYNLYLENNNITNKSMNNQNNYKIKDFKGMNPLDNYILNKNDELAPIYLTKNKNYQINKVLNNINLNINQKNDENNNKINKTNETNENNTIIKTKDDNVVTKNDINKKAAEYKIENINNIFYSKVKKINVNKKKRKKEERINKFKQLVEEKTVFSIINLDFDSPKKESNLTLNKINDDIATQELNKKISFSEESIFKNRKIIEDIEKSKDKFEDKINDNDNNDKIDNKDINIIENTNNNNNNGNDIKNEIVNNDNDKNNEIIDKNENIKDEELNEKEKENKNIINEECKEKEINSEVKKDENDTKEKNKKNTFNMISNMFRSSLDDSKNSNNSLEEKNRNKLSNEEEEEEKEEEEEENNEDEEDEEEEKEKENNEEEEEKEDEEKEINEEEDDKMNSISDSSKINNFLSEDIFSLIEKNANEINKATNELNEIKKNQEKTNKEENIIENRSSEEKMELNYSQSEEIRRSDSKNKENKKKKIVSFHEKENVYISFNQNEVAKKIKIYNFQGAKMPFRKLDLKKYISNLKKNTKLKSIILVKSPNIHEKENLEQKMALFKLSELIDECNDKSEGNESSLKEKVFTSKKGKSKNSKNTSNNDKGKGTGDKKYKKKKNYNFDNYISFEDKKKEKKENREKKLLFSERIKLNILNKNKNKQVTNELNNQKGRNSTPLKDTHSRNNSNSKKYKK